MKKTQTLLMLIIALSLSACGKERSPSDLAHYIKTLQNSSAAALAPLPALQVFLPYQYTMKEARSPFQTPVFKSVTGDRPNEDHEKTELEKFQINQLIMVGTLLREGKRWALVKAPDNIVYRVALGEYLGLDYGKVISIDEDKIIVEESMIQNNHWVQHHVEISLRKHARTLI